MTDTSLNPNLPMILAPSTVIGAGRGSGILTVELHNVTGMRPSSRPAETDQWPIYALLECENFQICSRAAWCGGKRGTAIWRRTFCFDVTTSPELVVHLSARNNQVPEGRPVEEPRGWFRIAPRPDGFYPKGKTMIDVQDGTGLAEVTVAYLQKEVPPLEDRDAWEFIEVNHVSFVHVTKKDTGREYAMATVQLCMADTYTALNLGENVNSLGSSLCHPFIAPLKFAFTATSAGRLNLLSPLASGGPLFYHLQKERRFDGDKARFYAAELILALEYLHSKHIIFALLDPTHLLLDAHGHISLCNPVIYSHSLPLPDARDCILPASLDFAAPELLPHHKATQAVDWWMLGVLLYEILAGRPPFYHKKAEEQQQKIIHQPLQLPSGLPPATNDILAALLAKDPLQRLGANGASEVKSHAFFHGIDWQRLLQRQHTSPLQPDNNTSSIFRLEPVERGIPKRSQRRLSRGTLYEYRDDLAGFGFPPLWQPIGHEITESERNALRNTFSSHLNDDAWDLTWDPSSEVLSFKQQMTGEEHVIESPSPAEPPKSSTAMKNVPSMAQLRSALAAALKEGHSNKVVSQVLEYGIDLNASILHYDHVPADTGIAFDLRNEAMLVTPLEWAVEHNRPDLVTLFLRNGADPNYTCHEVEGPALVRAVQRQAPELVRLLVAKTHRIPCTRALCAAIDRQNTPMIKTLLASGVRCEFEEEDIPPPLLGTVNYDNEQGPGTCSRTLQAGDLIAPLVRAVRLGNVSLVRLLLAHGADVNVGYHCDSDTGLLPLPTQRQCGWEDENGTKAGPRKVNFACGRVVQLAMELGHAGIVGLLIESGADVWLPQPVWAVQGHTCPLVPRTVWLDVTVGLAELK